MWNWYSRGVEDALELVQKGRAAGGERGRGGADAMELICLKLSLVFRFSAKHVSPSNTAH